MFPEEKKKLGRKNRKSKEKEEERKKSRKQPKCPMIDEWIKK